MSEPLSPGANKAAILYIVLVLIITGFSLSYHLLPGQRRAPESQEKVALDTVRAILSAQKRHLERFHKYGLLKDLVKKEFLDKSLEEGQDKRYRYSVVLVKEDSAFTVVASPLKKRSGSPYFFSNQDGKLYQSSKPIEIEKGQSEPRRMRALTEAR